MGSAFRTVVVANPKAGSALGRRAWRRLQAAVRRAIPEVEFVETRGPGDATERTREALRAGAEMIVAIGGDGTYSETVNGFFDEKGEAVSRDAVLGTLPAGTGGDFRKTVGLGRDPFALVSILADRAARPCDVGRVTYVDHAGREASQFFINIASFGLGGLVDDYVNRSSKAFGGFLSFGIATVRAMARFRPQQVRVRIDAEEPAVRRISVAAIANGRYFGGGMMIAPDARVDDGLFDVVVLEDMTLGDFLLRGHRVYAGTHIGMNGVTARVARRVEAEPIDPDEAVLLDVDGEAPGRLPAAFEVLHHAIRLKA